MDNSAPWFGVTSLGCLKASEKTNLWACSFFKLQVVDNLMEVGKSWDGSQNIQQFAPDPCEQAGLGSLLATQTCALALASLPHTFPEQKLLDLADRTNSCKIHIEL